MQRAWLGLGVLVLLLGWVTAVPAFAETPAGAEEQEEAEASEEEPDSEEDADGQQERRPGFGGPNQVENQIILEEIEKPRADTQSALIDVECRAVQRNRLPVRMARTKANEATRPVLQVEREIL